MRCSRWRLIRATWRVLRHQLLLHVAVQVVVQLLATGCALTSPLDCLTRWSR